jgi:PKD repeat protein
MKMIDKKLWLILLIGIALACKKKEKVNPADINDAVSANFKVVIDSTSYGRVIIAFKMEHWDYCTIDYGDGFENDYRPFNNPDYFPFESGLGIQHIYRENKEYKITLTAFRRTESGITTKAFQVQTVRISNIPPKAVADFSYEVLDNGSVKFTNLSQNALDFEWRGTSPYYTKTENPTFVFEKNGEYLINMTAYSPFHQSNKLVTINITNVKEEQAPTFTGTYLGNKGSFIGTGNVRFDGACCDGIPLGIPFLNFTVPDTDISLLVITSSLVVKDYTLADKYKAIKESFSVGKKDITYPEWWGGFVVLGVPTDRDAPKTLEITDIQEVSQVKLIPEMYDKALWITFKITGDFGKYGKVDGVLKLKYLVY